MNKFGNILWGIVFIVIGVIFGLNATGVTNIDIFFDGWWTLFIIVPCFIGIFKEKDKTGNLIGLLIGIILLLCSQDYIGFDMIWKLAFPAVLVIIGVSFIFKDTFSAKINDEIKKINAENVNAQKGEYCATFSTQRVNFDGEEFNGTTLTSVFGSTYCDLRNAVINSDQVINCSATFGGIDILLPDDVKVKVKSNSIFGGVSDKKSRSKDKDAKTIYINATCLFGGVDLK